MNLNLISDSELIKCIEYRNYIDSLDNKVEKKSEKY